MTTDQMPLESLLESIENDPEQLRMVMRSFTRHSRQYPTLARDIIAFDGLGSSSNEFWMAWKDAVLDLASDASDQSHLLTLIKRAVAALSGFHEGSRAVAILADLARIIPSSLELVMKHFEASFPYWKNSNSTPQLQNFTKNALNLGMELPHLLERIIDFLTRKILLIDLSIRPEDTVHLSTSNLPDSQSGLNMLVDAAGSELFSGNLTGLGEKYSQEEKARELEEAKQARQSHIDQIKDFASKIDLMLLALLEFIEKAKIKGKSREIGLFVLISFEKNVLPAIKPKFGQFIMFHAASIDNSVTDRLLGVLIAGLFARDSQLSTNTPKNNSNNSAAKVKSICSNVAYLRSFVQKSNSLNESQLGIVLELLSEWIRRKIEALTHLSKTPLEISILSAVVETFLEISLANPQLFKLEPHLKQAIELISSEDLPSNLKSHPAFASLFEGIISSPAKPASQKHKIMPFSSLPLPLSNQFLINSGIIRE